MPQIPGADLTTVSTDFEVYPAGEYVVTVQKSELANENRQVRIQSRIEEPVEHQGKIFTDFINIVQNDGKQNPYGLASIKQYLEAAFGKDSPESNTPDTDPLNGHQVRLLLEINEYVPKKNVEYEADGVTPKKKRNNQVKRVFTA